MPTKRKRAPTLPPPPSDEAACLTCLVRAADGIITAVHAVPDAPPLTVSIGQTLTHAFPAATRLPLLVERTARTGKVITIMLPLPDATSPLVRCTGTPLPGDDAPEYVLLAITPVPAGNFGALAPPEYSAELNTILSAVADGIIVYDRDGEALYYNPAALEILGWAAAGIDPRTLTFAERQAIYRLETPQGEPITVGVNIFARLASYGQQSEVRLHRPDGSSVVLMLRPAIIHDDLTGEILGAVHVLRDVTAWRMGDAIKDEFMSVAVHELRAPLQPLLLASRFIQRWIDRPERHDDLVGLAEEIARQTKRMTSLVQDMFDMTRINSGVFVITPAACDLAAIVRNVAEEQQTISQRDMLVVGADAPLTITADSERLWQALTNLISNAIKYSAAPATVEVTMMPILSDGAPWVRITVADRGIGIPPDHLPRLFERFYRASVTYQMAPQQHDGLGLGLYISQAIIASHGGRLTATSEVGVGSTFIVELPVE
jgi:two-component system phosphate regulon sensor histidine kinase PhoR